MNTEKERSNYDGEKVEITKAYIENTNVTQSHNENIPKYYRKDNEIYFGTYPQTKFSDPSIVSLLTAKSGALPTASDSKLWTSYGYYINGKVSDYMWYVDVALNGEKYRGVYFTSYKSIESNNPYSEEFTCQENNGYVTSNVNWFKFEPIKWRILSESNGNAFLITDLAIDCRQFYHTDVVRIIDGKKIYPNNYAESEIRKWLNETFYNTAFDSFQKEIIQTVAVDNSVSGAGYRRNRYVCSKTFDKIFLLSVKEIKAYLPTDSNRQVKSSDYAKEIGCYYQNDCKYKENCWWWLRSPSKYESYFVCGIDYVGLCYEFNNVDCINGGVLPALIISLS